MRAFLGALVVLALGCSAFLTPVEVRGSSPAPAGAEATVVRFYAKGEQICSGVAIGPHDVLTARHCVRDQKAADLRVGIDSEALSVPVEDFAEDPVFDIAALRLKLPLPPPYAELGEAPVMGARMYVVGYGCSRRHNTKRLVHVARYVARRLPLQDLALRGVACRGDSGGAAFDAYGRLVGITWGVSRDGIPMVYATDVTR